MVQVDPGPGFYFTGQEVLGIGLYLTVIGYFFLMFGYFLFIRFFRTKRMYWLYFSLFFIFLAASRVFYLIYDYFLIDGDAVGHLVMWKAANITAWIAVAALSGILSILLFTGDSKFHVYMKVLFPVIPLGIAIHIIFLPTSWILDDFIAGLSIAKFYMNAIILPLYIILLPFMFFYLAKKSLGALQRSFFLNGLGLLIYYAARAIQPVLPTLLGADPATSYTVGLVPPLVILLAILLISFANQYEHLK
ncbi:MAG: hypothetical protein ACTSUE_19720 [Promethearchaeota archaeon]